MTVTEEGGKTSRGRKRRTREFRKRREFSIVRGETKGSAVGVSGFRFNRTLCDQGWDGLPAGIAAPRSTAGTRPAL